MLKIVIDEKPLEVEEGATVFKAAQKAGISIPHFCYHPAFKPEGTCRVCLVEIEGLPNLELACSTQVREGMKIFTKSERVVDARKGVLEFLLAEHPLDCPICDQAGDCKLQDYYEEYGLFENQFDEHKDKHDKKVRLGKNLIHDQERCVLCRRCVRFLREITQTNELGVFERGGECEINIIENFPVDNNYSGNLAMLCPVGAITDLDFRFKTRSWFLERGESICPLCSRGCNIFIDYHKGFSRFPLPQRVYRVTARENPEVNGFWICDRGRYGYSYLDRERTDKILANKGKTTLKKQDSISLLTENIKTIFKKRAAGISLILNGFLSNEEFFLIKKIFQDDMNVENISFTVPLSEKGDDFLLTSEWAPNERGAKKLGFDLKKIEAGTLSKKTELLLVFGDFFSGEVLSEMKEKLSAIPLKILFSAHTFETDDLFDVILPTALIAEKEGSLTNVDEKVQHFKPVFQPPGDGIAEWEWLVLLGKQLNLNSQYYNQFSSLETISEEMKKQNPFFGKNSE